MSEIRNCNYNCENSAVPLGTRRGWAGRYQDTGDTDTALPADTAALEQIDRQLQLTVTVYNHLTLLSIKYHPI